METSLFENAKLVLECKGLAKLNELDILDFLGRCWNPDYHDGSREIG